MSALVTGVYIMGLIAIGDIHGCAKTLDALLKNLSLSKEDHLVFVGDYVDRGPNTRGVIERLIQLQTRIECTFLKGNHEALMLDYIDEGEYDLWHANGGVSTLSSYVNENRQIAIPKAHVQFIRDAKSFYDTPDFFFVHAGLKPNQSIAVQMERANDDVFLWERRHLDAKKLAWEKPVVCGHTPQSQPINRDLLICIDTGCVYTMHPKLGNLTAVRLPEREFVSVPYCD